MTNQDPIIGQDEMARIEAAFESAAKLAATSAARRERKVEDILHGDIPTFMELPVARKPDQLAGADAAVLGFGYEGITIKTPWLSAPPTVSRPEPGSVYWRMGADKAPDEIRKYSMYYSIHHNRGFYPEIDPDLMIFDHLKVMDYGNVEVVQEDTWETLRRASEKVSHIVKHGALPIVLGGDHTIPFPTLRAILENRQQKIGLISFDSHLDLSNTPEYWASSEWAKTFELGKLSPKNFVQIGIRSNRSTQYEVNVAKELGIRVYTIDEVKARGIQTVMNEALDIVNDGTDGLYASLDIDVMEPGLVPAQKAPEFWGLTVDEIMQALRLVSRQKLIGYDVCEMSPDYDINGMSAQFCARTVVEILAGLALRKKEEGS
ncbi:MAG: agmatinase family protein [Chloroflexota bacterium]